MAEDLHDVESLCHEHSGSMLMSDVDLTYDVAKMVTVNQNSTKTSQQQNALQQVIPEVVNLNVGGVAHTTSLSTLQKYPDSMLGAMFSGRHHISTDNDGRFFIDRDGLLFQHILNFMRQGTLPELSDCLKVYQEAQFFNIQPLVDALELLRPVAGEKLKRGFLEHVPDYHANLHLLLSMAHQIASSHPDRTSRLKVCVHKQEGSSFVPSVHAGDKNKNHMQQKHMCDVSVTFGPWTASPDVYDLLDCIKHDLAEKGYEIEYRCIGVCDKHIAEQHFCKRSIFEFKFKWW